MISLENWVEKYLPLKMHTMVTEQLENVINPKKLEDFRSISKLIAEKLRNEIFADCGYSRLKARALDLITELRLENSILNEEKAAAKLHKGNSNLNVPGLKDAKQEAQDARVLAL